MALGETVPHHAKVGVQLAGQNREGQLIRGFERKDPGHARKALSEEQLCL